MTAGTARILRTFVERPGDQAAWLTAWDLTVGQIAQYLRAWESRGRRLPLDLFAGSDRHRDLAVVVIGELFYEGKNNNPCPLAHHLEPHLNKCDDGLVEQFLAIIRKTTRQNVHKIERENGLEAWNIRRNLRRVLRQSKGEYLELADLRGSEWGWTKAKNSDRKAFPSADDATLHAWVVAASRDQAHTPGQCRHVFAALDADDRFRNALSYYRLVKVFVAVQLDHDLPQEILPDSPLLVRVRGLIHAACHPAREETLSQDLPHLARLAGLSDAEIHGVSVALGVWLDDWVEHFENDSLREYLCEQLGEIPLPVYQKRFHYLWNTLTGKCKDRILGRVRKQMGIG